MFSTNDEKQKLVLGGTKQRSDSSKEKNGQPEEFAFNVLRKQTDTPIWGAARLLCGSCQTPFIERIGLPHQTRCSHRC